MVPVVDHMNMNKWMNEWMNELLQLESNKYSIFRKHVYVAFVIQQAKHILNSILLHVACPSLPYFFRIVL